MKNGYCVIYKREVQRLYTYVKSESISVILETLTRVAIECFVKTVLIMCTNYVH